jgi:hypothetical protein
VAADTRATQSLRPPLWLGSSNARSAKHRANHRRPEPAEQDFSFTLGRQRSTLGSCADVMPALHLESP